MIDDTMPRGVRVLVVGHDLRSMEIIRDAADRLGLCSSYASSIPEAVAEAHHYPPALLIIEISHDKLQSSLWLARTMRAHYGASVIFVTEHPDEEMQRVIAAGGGGGIFKRPFHRAQLMQGLRLTIDWHRLRTAGQPTAPAIDNACEECAS